MRKQGNHRRTNTNFVRRLCCGFGLTESPRAGAFDSAKNRISLISLHAKKHKCQRRKRQSVTAIREKSQTLKFV